jgi:hypothetical protein
VKIPVFKPQYHHHPQKKPSWGEFRELQWEKIEELPAESLHLL